MTYDMYNDIVLFVTKFKKNAGVTYLYTIKILLSSIDCFF